MAFVNDGSYGYELFGTTSPVTGSAPTEATDGQPLKDLVGLTLIVSLGATRTFSATGTVDCYLYDGKLGRWCRYPAGDVTTVGAPAVRDLVFAPSDVVCGRNSRVKWVPTAVTFNAGADGVTIHQLGQIKNGVY